MHSTVLTGCAIRSQLGMTEGALWPPKAPRPYEVKVKGPPRNAEARHKRADDRAQAERNFVLNVMSGFSEVEALAHLKRVAKLAGVPDARDLADFVLHMLASDTFVADALSELGFVGLYEKYVGTTWWQGQAGHLRAIDTIVEYLRAHRRETPTNLYSILGLSTGAAHAEVRAAYVRLAKLWHPDVAGVDTTERMAQINAAYAILQDVGRRSEYDRVR